MILDNSTTVHIEILINEKWENAAKIKFINNYTYFSVEYEIDYSIEHLGLSDNHAISINYPVNLFKSEDDEVNGIIDDLIPSGASRKFWLKHLDIESISPGAQKYILLKYSTVSPIGNLRVRESLDYLDEKKEITFFSLKDIKERSHDFLEYANEKGGVAGGATGAAGEAPKLLLRYGDDEHIWIDAHQDYKYRKDDLYFLVKYPRGKRTNIDCDIIRAEYHYYHELESMGFSTIKTKEMRLEENEFDNGYPSIWLPRFDVEVKDGIVTKYSMQSVYSILKKGSGSFLIQEDTVRKLISLIKDANLEIDNTEFITEWINRDLLNVIFGNSDNHGRNTSFLIYNKKISLSPIYDFAPMKADPEGIVRTSKWSSEFEIGGEYKYLSIAESFGDIANSEYIIQSLKATASKLIGLKDRLIQRGVPPSITEMPVFGFDYIEDKLARWGLYEK